LTSFVTPLVVVDPFGVVPIFTALTMAADDGLRQGILRCRPSGRSRRATRRSHASAKVM
jgi:hypothetical protein